MIQRADDVMTEQSHTAVTSPVTIHNIRHLGTVRLSAVAAERGGEALGKRRN